MSGGRDVCWVAGDSVLPAVPDDVEPGAGEDSDRVGVFVPSGDGGVVRAGSPGVGVSAVAGEVGDSFAELFVCGPTESTVFDFAELAGGGRDSGQADQRFRGGKAGSAVPISLSRRAARKVPERGVESLDRGDKAGRHATKAPVVGVPSVPGVPRGALVSRR